MLNNLFAIFKVVLLFAIAVAGFIVSRQANSGTSDFNRGASTWSSIDALAAMIYIIFTYEGWEYTNYVRDMPRESFTLTNDSKDSWGDYSS